MPEILKNIADLALEAAPWLLFGLVLAGAIRALVPMSLMQRWLGGSGLWPVTKAAIIGAPIPICSCGVVPAALSLRNSGASKASTLSFLIATPETGVDSVAVTYAMMGPLMAIFRPIAAVLSAIGVGVMTGISEENEARSKQDRSVETACGCHDDECHVEADAVTPRLGARLVAGLRYAFADLYDEIVWWLVLGLVVAGAVVTFVSPSLLAEIGSGLPAKLLMFLIGIPMYICATASTPLAASLLFAGVSPGTVLVFLLAGPATNLGTVGIIRREFGQRILVTYLATLAVFTIGAGLLTDVIVDALGVDIAAQLHERQHLLPLWLQLSTVLLLVLFAVPRLRTPLIDLFSRPATR